MSIRPYNSSVRIGNWNEDIQLEEDTLKDFLDKKDRGELQLQKGSNLRETMLAKTKLSISRDGYVHFGDTIMLINLEPKDKSRVSSSLSINPPLFPTAGPVGVSNSKTIESQARTIFVVVSNDGSASGTHLRYNQPFYLRTGLTGMFLFADRATFQKAAKRSRRNEVVLVDEPSHLTEWIIKPYDPQFRPELEHTPVPANQRIVCTHLKTNQNLHIEKDFFHRTLFGREHEITCYTDLDSHRAEKDSDHWVLTMNVPGGDFEPLDN